LPPAAKRQSADFLHSLPAHSTVQFGTRAGNSKGEQRMAPTVILIPGDGIGPEVANATMRLLEAAGAEIIWEEHQARPLEGHGLEELRADPLVSALLRAGVGLKGPITTPVAGGHGSINVALRRALELYANFRPVKRIPGVRTPFEHVDLIIVRFSLPRRTSRAVGASLDAGAAFLRGAARSLLAVLEKGRDATGRRHDAGRCGRRPVVPARPRQRS